MVCSKCAHLKRIALTQLEHQYALRYQQYGTKADVTDLDARRENIEKASKCKKASKQKVNPENKPQDNPEPSTEQDNSLDVKLV